MFFSQRIRVGLMTENRKLLMGLGAIVFAGAMLRFFAASGDLWLDEIISLDHIGLARTLSTAADKVGIFFHDNTHPINTFYLAAVNAAGGAKALPVAYRALAIISGVAMIGFAAAIGLRRSACEGLVAAAMIAFSYPMVHYASEARGYAPMLLALLAAVYYLERYLEAPGPGRAFAFIGVSLLGLFSHLTFVVALAALGLWAAVGIYKATASIISTLARLSVLFGFQAILTTAYGVVAVGNLVYGGRGDMPIEDSLGMMYSVTFGIDPLGLDFGPTPVSMALLLALAGLMGLAVWRTHKLGDGSWIFLFLFALVYPLFFLIFDPPIATLHRYFIAPALVALMAAARLGAGMITAGGILRAVAGAGLALFFIGNGILLEKSISGGRGAPALALKAIDKAGNMTGNYKIPALIAAYPSFSFGTVVNYYVRELGLADRVRFIRPEDETKSLAPWFISSRHFAVKPKGVKNRWRWYAFENFSGEKELLSVPEFLDRKGPEGPVRYKRFAVFPNWGLSGATWIIYRRP